MKNRIVLKLVLLTLIFVGWVFAGSAFAAKDVIYPSGATATVNSNPATLNPTNFPSGSNGSATLDADVYAEDSISVSATWSIKDNSVSGTNTTYSRTVKFTTAIASTPGSTVSIGSIENCIVTSASDTCTTVIRFPAPDVIGNYQIQVTADDTVTGGGSNQAILGRVLSINFSVAEQQEVEKLDTKLLVAKKCVLLNQGNVDLTATLEELDSTNSIADADIYFYINPALDNNGDPTVPSIGTEKTNADGVATLTYNINGLGVGDHNLYCEFDGDDTYNPSNDSNTLGISYVFGGFRPPINADGTSIFGGRVIPIKIKLVDFNGAPVTDATPTVWLTCYSKELGLGEVLEQVSSVSAADTGNTMRYVPEEQQYIYNWDATNLINGTYAVVVNLGDSSACRPDNPYAIITVAKKGGKK